MNYIFRPLRIGVRQLSRVPLAFDTLRWILEGGYRQHRALLERHLTVPSTSVLDLGCGTGIYARCIDPRVYVGIDVSPSYIRRAQQNFPHHRFEVMDATHLEFSACSFDTVMISGVLHHLDAAIARQVLSEVSRVLKPLGRLLLWEDVPTQDPYNLVGKLVHKLDVGEHIRPSDEYKDLLSADFCVETTECFRSGFMDYAVFMCRKRVPFKSIMGQSSDCEQIESIEDAFAR